MSDHSSEKIAKALKGAGLSAKKRIEKAYEAWNDDSIFFPNKDDFLFEWLCSALSKPNMKKLDDCSLIQFPYWKLLVELLEHYKVKQQPPMIHINLVLCISNLLQQLYKQDQFINNVEARVEFLKTVHRVVDLLFSDEFNLGYRPAFEHVSVAVDQVLSMLLEQIKLAQTNEETEADSLYQLSQIGYLLSKKFDGQLVLAANQKKIYTSIVDKSLKKLLSVRRRISLLTWSEHGDRLATMLTTIICHALFHADTVLEYTSVLKDVDSMDAPIQQNNYVAKIFDVLDNAVKEGQDDPEGALDALDITPVLFSAFLEAFRQKRNTSTSAMQDTSRMAEFGFFVYMLKIIHHSQDLYLETLSRLLKAFVQWNVYHTRNDDITKSQREILNQIADEIVSYLNNDTKQYNHGLVLDVADVLLQTDFSLIETRMHHFWPILLNPDPSFAESCMQFAKSILATYSASRQLDSFIEDLIHHIEQLQVDDLYAVLQKPMFSKEFLNAFSASITKHAPPAQYIILFNYFSEKIISNMSKFKNVEPSKKKQKTNNNNNGFAIRLIGIYFIKYLNALKLNQHQRNTFESSKLYTDFIQPSIDTWKHTKQEECAALPAIQIHFALVNVFYENYLNKLEQEDLQSLAAAFEEMIKYYLNKKYASLGSRLTLVEAVNAMLQSIYYHSLFPEKHIYQDGKVEALSMLITFLTENKGKKEPWYQSTTWDGNLLDIKDMNTVKLACWKLLVDEWFEAIIHFIDAEEAKKIVNIVFMSLTSNTNKDNRITAQVLNTTLLRSANFYEVECFKDWNVKAVIAALTDLFKRKLVKSSSNTISRIVAEMVINNVSKGDDKLDQALNDEIMEQDVKESSTKDVASIVSLMRLLLLFPNEYYEKNERQNVLALATLVDMWVISCVDADPLMRAKASLVCRSLYLRFIDFFSINSLLGTSSSVLKWLVLSADKYYFVNSTDRHILHSLEQVTNVLDKSIIRSIMAATNTESTRVQSVPFIQDTLKQSVDDLLKEKGDTRGCLNRISNILEVVNQVLLTRKSTEIDLDNVIYAKDMVAVVSEHLDTMLQNTKTTISKLTKQIGNKKEDTDDILSGHIYEFNNIKQVLQLTRLIQTYAKMIGPDIDQVISAKEQSSSLISLAPLFIDFIKTVLDTVHQQQSILDMVTEFTVALCSILPRYQDTENPTQHTLDTVWFVYSTMLDTQSDEAVHTLSSAFSAWIRSLDVDQFDIVIQEFMNQSQKELNESEQLAFLSLLAVLLNAGSDVHKKQLGKTISNFVLKLSLMAGKTRSLKFFQQVLKFVLQISNSQSYHLSEYDVSILLSCLFQVAHPTALQRFKTEINESLAHEVFDDVCAVLTSLIGQRKEQVVDMLPPLIAFIQSLMHCFKSTHVSLVGNTSQISKKRKHVDNKSKAQHSTEQFGNRTVPLLVSFAPLNDTSAQKFSRLLSVLPAKQSTGGRSAQSLYKTIAKHTPSIIIEYFHIQSNSTMSIIQPTKKSILVSALYDVFDMCNDLDRSFIMSCLDGSGKSLFKTFYSGWKETHKYSGE